MLQLVLEIESFRNWFFEIREILCPGSEPTLTFHKLEGIKRYIDYWDVEEELTQRVERGSVE